jgi:hypothetical protein
VKYSEYRPTSFDLPGLGCDDRQDWTVVCTSRTRDSDCLEESNFVTALESLGGEGVDVEVHRFGHWGHGWLEIILVRPGSAAETEAESIACALADYPVLSDEDLSEREHVAADQVWANCYSVEVRIAYIRGNRRQFEFHSLADMMGCVRGKYFAGHASELLH